MRFRWFYVIFAAAVAFPLSAGCSGCGSSKGDPNTIKIVSSLPRTGSAKAQTDTIVNGIKMAFDEAGNQVGQFKIVYEDLDDATAADGKWNSDRETANAEQATKDPDVMIFIGPYNSGAAKFSMPITNRASLLMISPACTAIGLTHEPGDPGEPGIYPPAGDRKSVV